MKIGNSEIEKLYIGEDEVDKLYLGTDLIYENSDESALKSYLEWFTDNQSALESDSRSVDFAQTLYLPTQFDISLRCTLTTADDSTYFRVEMMGGDNMVRNEMTDEEITPSQEVIDGVTYDVFELGVTTVFEDYWSAVDMNMQLQDYGSEVYFS